LGAFGSSWKQLQTVGSSCNQLGVRCKFVTFDKMLGLTNMGIETEVKDFIPSKGRVFDPHNPQFFYILYFSF
jgi:hypothetical protein